jgi:hypothetical protein
VGYGHKDRSWVDGGQFEEDDPPVVEFYKRQPDKPRASKGPGLNTALHGAPPPKKASNKDSLPQKKPPLGKTQGSRKSSKATESGDESEFVISVVSDIESDVAASEAAEDSDLAVGSLKAKKAWPKAKPVKRAPISL